MVPLQAPRPVGPILTAHSVCLHVLPQFAFSYSSQRLALDCQLHYLCWNSLSAPETLLIFPETDRETTVSHVRKSKTASASCEEIVTKSSKHRILN